ncbi:Uncharacterized protein DBV15_09602 [Temnothorax longispinosus]|uniref:Uncharacterized protein n=1 Tax=Temnothorax longispinosus TaxID=300112 RepID=A0A4S2KEK3_9HYME|nr:Uncharacterized protein DBV15_09602 [Temnothorax longispinosus]
MRRRPLCLVVVEQQHGNTTVTTPTTIGFFDASSSDIDPFGRDRASRAPPDVAERDVSDTPPCPLPEPESRERARREPRAVWRAVFYRVRGGAMLGAVFNAVGCSPLVLLACSHLAVICTGPPLRRTIRISSKKAYSVSENLSAAEIFNAERIIGNISRTRTLRAGIYTPSEINFRARSKLSIKNPRVIKRLQGHYIFVRSRQRELASSFRCRKPAEFQRGKIVSPELLPFLPRIPTLPEEYKDPILMKYAVTVMNAAGNQVTSSVFFVKLLLSRSKIPTVPPLTSELCVTLEFDHGVGTGWHMATADSPFDICVGATMVSDSGPRIFRFFFKYRRFEQLWLVTLSSGCPKEVRNSKLSEIPHRSVNSHNNSLNE